MMATENNQCFDFKINESDELNRQKIFNSSLIKELRKYREENIKLKHEKELLNSIIKKLVEENKTLRSNLSSIKNKNPHEETMEIVENILHSNDEIKDEPLDFYNLIQKFSNNCESCDKTFSDEEDLKLHRKAKHDHKKTEYGITSKKSRQQNPPIDETNKVGENANNTNNHQNYYYGQDQQHQMYAFYQQQPPPAKKAKLDNWLGAFFGGQIFGGQLELHHENNQNLDHQCDQCPKKFPKKFLLNKHKKDVHGEKIPCEQCGQEFTQKSSLNTHIMGVHERIRRFKCDKCDKAYFQASGLNYHKKIHAEEKSNENFDFSAFLSQFPHHTRHPDNP